MKNTKTSEIDLLIKLKHPDPANWVDYVNSLPDEVVDEILHFDQPVSTKDARAQLILWGELWDYIPPQITLKRIHVMLQVYYIDKQNG